MGNRTGAHVANCRYFPIFACVRARFGHTCSMASRVSVAFAGVLLACVVVAAGPGCGSSGNNSHGGADGGTPGPGDDGGPSLFGNGDGGSKGTLAIAPLSPTLTVVTGKPVPTQKFTATFGGHAVQPAWGIDQGQLGSIDATGLLTPTGTLGGVAHVTASYSGQKVSTTVTTDLQTMQLGDPGWSSSVPDAGAGGYGGVGGAGPGAPPTSGQVTTLSGTPTADASVSLLYPYDGTVWPQGMLAPLAQWAPGSHTFDSAYVHIKENNYEYKGYFAANGMPFVNLPIPQQAWTAMSLSNAGEPVTITLVFGQGTTAYGPYTETWTIAQATLQGTIYYNSYGTALVKNSDTPDNYGNQYGAGTLSILPGATSPTLTAGINSPMAGGDGTGCRVCHTVAANGQSLVTEASNATASDYSDTVRIDLANDTTGGAGTSLATTNLTFPALYKDGSLLLSNETTGFTYPGSLAGTSQLYALPAGTPVAGVTGLGTGLQAGMPAFSPDGAHVSFNFWGGTLTGATTLTGDQVSLAVLDFDGKSAFSNPRVLYTPTGGASVTYSSFLPDASGVVFELELQNPSNAWGYTWHQNTAELWWADIASGMAHRLDSLNGYGPSAAVYLPGNGGTHTPAVDATLNYEPTVNPIASGGYAWVVFTSRRMYGNVAQLDPWTSDPRNYPWLDQVTDKKLWVAAVDLHAKPGTDPSHPAFYLPAQELHAGNARGYWTVEPCRGNGQSCQTGDQCCGGYCQASDAGLVCSSTTPTCSNPYDKCTTTTDCCSGGQGVECIGGYCTQSSPAQ